MHNAVSTDGAYLSGAFLRPPCHSQEQKSFCVVFTIGGKKYFLHVKLNLESLSLINLDAKMPDREEGGDLALWKAASGVRMLGCLLVGFPHTHSLLVPKVYCLPSSL